MKRKKGIEFDRDVRDAINSDPEYAAEYFAELIKRPLPVQLLLLRKFLGMTQEELAKIVKVSRQSIISVEKGQYVCTTILALKIAAALKAKVEDLFVLEKND